MKSVHLPFEFLLSFHKFPVDLMCLCCLVHLGICHCLPQNQFAALNAPKKDDSQIEGPSIANSYGFKVSMQNLQDAKALHEVSCNLSCSWLTLLSHFSFVVCLFFLFSGETKTFQNPAIFCSMWLTG